MWLQGQKAPDGASGNRKQHVEEVVRGAQVEARSGEDILVGQSVIGWERSALMKVVRDDVLEHGTLRLNQGGNLQIGP